MMGPFTNWKLKPMMTVKRLVEILHDMNRDPLQPVFDYMK